MKPIRVFNHTLHKEMWNWIADNPKCIKEEWPGWNKLSESEDDVIYEHFFCFACIAAGQSIKVIQSKCCNCPLDWGHYMCTTRGAYYDLWRKYYGDRRYAKAAKYARKIANLPLKKNLDCGDYALVVI